MKNRILLVLGLVSLMFISVGLFFLGDRSVTANSNARTTHPLKSINEKARAVRMGSHSEALDLVDEIIRVANVEPELDSFATDAVKVRVAKAENIFRRENVGGVSEQKVVLTINRLVHKLRLPAYARTSVNEVTRLRFMLLPNFPEIVSRKSERSSPIPVGARFNTEMSPAEGFFVLVMMFQQKLYNPEFQLTHEERLSLWNELYADRPVGSIPQNLPNNRGIEVRGAIRNAGQRMSSQDALNLSELTLNTLGVKREGGNGQ